ncbi:hypothetical protein ACFFRR_009183 [Megaselia abdita]
MIENNSGNSLFEDIEIFASEFYSFLLELLDTIVKKSSFPSLNFDSVLIDNFATNLQITLLKVIFLLLLTSIVLSGICWRKYGEVITEKFIKPSTQKEIEELKLSVAKLKLPKEHSPRI